MPREIVFYNIRPEPFLRANQNRGYALPVIKYADVTTREFLSANKTGISVYILGIEEKKYLAEAYGKDLGKASVTGYCIRFAGSKRYKH